MTPADTLGLRLARRLHALLLGVCCASLAFGWLEGLYFFFAMPGPSPMNMRDDLIPGGLVDYALMPLIFLLGMPLALFAPCCGCCAGAAVAETGLTGDAAAARGCSRCCSRCCAASFGRVPRSVSRRSDAALAAALPTVLLLAAIPWPAKAPKAVLVHLAFVIMAVWLRRAGVAGGAAFGTAAPLASQSVLLLACIRTAAWTPNILFWSLPHAALVALPALLLQAALRRREVRASGSPDAAEPRPIEVLPPSPETAALQPQVPREPVEPETTPAIAVQAESKEADGAAAADPAVAPSSAHVVAAALGLTTLAHYVIYIAPSPSLLVRGADLRPETSDLQLRFHPLPGLGENLIVLVSHIRARGPTHCSRLT